MKNLILLSIIFLMTFSLNAQWVQIGPPGGAVHSLAISGSNVFAGTSLDVYCSSDNGQSWDPAFIGSIVSALAVNGSNVFAGAAGPSADYLGVYRSTDSGQNWIHTSLNNTVVHSLAVSDSNVFAGTDYGVYLSTDNGQNWSRMSLYSKVLSIKISGSDVFAGTYHGVYHSTNNGQNWQQTTLDSLWIESLAVTPNGTSGSNIFAGTSFYGVYLSTDNGQNWTQTSLNNTAVYSLDVNGSNVFAGTYSGAYFSTDNGQTWTQIALNNQFVYSLAVNGSNVFAGTNSGVYLNWKQTASNFLIVTALTDDGPNVFAGTWDSGVYFSMDNGQKWTQTALMIQNVNLGISSLAISGSNVFAVTACYTCDPIHQGDEYNFMFLSTDNGQNWTQTLLDAMAVYSVAASGSYVFAGTYSGVYLSKDNGLNWTQTALNNQDVGALAVNGSTVFAGTYSGVYRSTNYGQSWTQTSSNGAGLLAVNGLNVFAGNYDGLYRSTDNGQRWTRISFNIQHIRSLDISGSNVFVGTYYGVYLSTDNGETWSQINDGLENQNIWSLTISSDYIYAGTWGTSVWKRPLSEIISGIEEQKVELPDNFILEQNYPNPFNPSTTIRYQILASLNPSQGGTLVTLKVYDILGKEVATLVNEEKPAGSYEVEFNSHSGLSGIRELSSGVYFYQLRLEGPETSSGQGFVETKKMVLIK